MSRSHLSVTPRERHPHHGYRPSPQCHDIDAAARDIAAVWPDVDEVQIEVEVSVEIPAHAAEMWTLAQRKEDDARAAVAEAARLNREAVKSLTADGFSRADIARILCLSPQRSSQSAELTRCTGSRCGAAPRTRGVGVARHRSGHTADRDHRRAICSSTRRL